MYTSHQINALIIVDPEEAAKFILQALRKAKMQKMVAVKILGCSHGTFLRWVEKLKLDSRIEKLRRRALREGWHFERIPSPGRPKGSKDREERVRRWKKAPSVTPG